MAKQLNVNLAFTADANKAKTEIKTLQTELISLINLTNVPRDFKFTNEVKEATIAAAQLKTNIENAVNVNTGKLDLGKFQQGMKQSNMSMEKYRDSLIALGPAGEQAFIKLANSVSAADMPLRRTNALTAQLWTTMKNTARWQLSSSMLHGFMGTISTAYGYAQDLNKSLNNIRIVTGYSADEMAKFAVEANAAARALNTTTTEYTNASLIFYQQGLNTQEVKERTDVTIKLANVARQSVEETSDQLTAVWNNFAKEGDNLERYADVLTALGAATASSTAEIAGGLEKFASIADMIGLSYDYAASALATITATTRQSEDVVGTALKTIFARIQGLNLGETLDDGTTLNKYSEALNKVGISIYDQAGALKEMDAILDEMGSKWDTLSKDQQVALAQTVAGVRQYNQLVSLMDNWDFMQENLSTASGAAGELSAQADIYAESWEAASERVRAAAENIFDSILKDDFFIDILNSTENVLVGIGEIVDSMGGLGGVAAGLSSILFSVFGPQLTETFNNLKLNILSLTKEGKQAALDLRVSAQQEVIEMYDKKMTANPDVYNVSTAAAQKDVNVARAKLTQELALNAERLSQSERDTLSYMLDQNAALGEQLVSYAKIQDISRHAGSEALGELSFDLGVDLSSTRQELESIANSTDKGKKSFSDYATAFQNSTIQIERDGKIVTTTVREQMESLGWSQDRISKVTHETVGYYRTMGNAVDDAAESNTRFNKSAKYIHETIQNGIPSLKTFGDVMVSASQGVSQISMALFSLNSAIDTISTSIQEGNFEWKDLLSIVMSLSMALPMLATGYRTLQAASIKAAIVNALNVASERQLAKAKEKTAAANRAATETQRQETTQQERDIIVNEVQAQSEKKVSKVKVQKRIAPKGKKVQTSKASTSGGSVTTEGTVAEGAASGGVEGATKGLTSGGRALLGKLGLITAAIIVVAGTIAWAVHQANKAERTLEKAKKSARELTDNYNTVKDAYDDFNQKNSDYSSAVESLNSLTKGTVDYQEAVLKANEAASELLATNSALKYTIEDGLIVVDKKSIEETKKAEMDALAAAQAAKMAGQTNVSRAEEDLKKRDMARELTSYEDDSAESGNVLAATGAGAGAGALVGSAIPVIGTAFGAAAGALVGMVSGLIATSTVGTSSEAETETLEKLEKAYIKDSSVGQQIKDGTFDYASIGIEDTALIASLQANGEKVSELVKEMAKNTSAIDAQNDLVASQALADNEKVQKSDYQNEIVDIIGDSYGIAYDKAMKSDWIDEWGKDDISKASGANKKAKEIFEQYLKYAGLEDQGYTLTDTTGTDKNRKFVYTDKEGETHEVSLEAMQAARAAAEASETLDAAATSLAKTFDKLAASGDEADQALLSFLSTKNFEQATKSEFDDVNAELTQSYTDKNGNVDYQSYLKDSLGVQELNDDVAIQYGYESAKAMVDAFSKGIEDTNEAWENVKVPENLNENISSEISLGTAEALQKQISQMNLGPLGEEAGKQYVEKLNSVLAEIDPEDQQKALSQLTQIDWSNYDALEQADQILQDFGVDIDTASQEWLDFANSMRIANGAQPDFSKIKNDLIEISKILGNLDFGKTISEEDYQKLIKYKDGWKDFFILQADGTRKFIGNASQMQQVTQDNIQQQRQELEKRAQVQKDFEDQTNWGIGEGSERVALDWEEMASEKGQAYQFDENGNATAYVSTVETARNLMNSDGATQAMLETLGYDDDVINQMVSEYNKAMELLNDDDTTNDASAEEVRKAAEDRIKEMFGRIGSFENEDMDAADAELDEMMASTATNFNELDALYNAGQISAEAYSKQMSYLTHEFAAQATTLDELQQIQNVDPGAYIEGLLRIGAEYANCSDELEAYNRALASNNSATQEKAKADLEAAIIIGEAAEKYNLNAEELEYQAKALQDANKEMKLTAKQAAKLAVQNQRMNKGVSDLVDNWKDWKKTLTTTNKDSSDYAKTAVALTKTIADLVGASDNLELPSDFFDNADNMALLEKAASGSADAINELGLVVAAESASMMEFDSSMYRAALAAGNTFTEGFATSKANVIDGINALKNAVIDGTVTAGNAITSLGNQTAADWATSLNEMALKTGMSVDEMNSLLSSMGVDAEVVTTEVPQKVKVPVYETITSAPEDLGDGRTRQESQTNLIRYEEMDGVVSVAQINMGETGDSPDIKYVGNGSVSPSSTKGNKTGGKSSKKEKKDPKRDIERYHTVKQEIEDLNRELSRVEANKEQAFGKAKLPFIKEELVTIGKLIEKNKQYQAQIKQMADYDWSQISAYGFIDANSDGILDNWLEVQQKMMKEYNAAVDKFNKDGDEATFEAAEKRYNDFLELVEQYEKTQKALEDAIDEGAELERKRISKELEEITTEVDFEIEIKQRDLDRLERIVDRLSRDTNNMIEIIDKLGEQVNAYGDQSQLYINGIQRIQQNATSEGRELTDEEQRKIWEYQDALEKINDSLEDIIETVENSLLEEFERWNSEIDDNISRFDTYSSTLEHYSEIIKLSGRATKDSALLMSLQMQKTSIAMQELNAVYDKYQANLDAQKNVKEKLDLAIVSGDAEDIEYWKKQYDEITKTVEKNAEEVAATWQDALQAASDEFDFVVEQTIQKLKDSISEFGLDGLADRYEKAKTINEQYLSDLDKEYELNKLIRQVEGSIDETDNLNAKRELIKLLDEINEKTAEGVKLSQYDLEYMQAEYELELAKLALEEARNAKTSVRLQRGDDGNYSYVYTADQEAIANAEQNYEDKLHAIKTLSQNHIDEMSDLIIQNEQELMEALAAVDRTKFETEEAYQAELNRITEYYYERDTYLRTELNKAVQNMGLVYGDTILGQLENCSTWEQAQEQLKTNTNTAITTMVSAWNKWKNDTETAMSMVGTSSNTLTNTIQTDATKIATATSNLASTIDTQTSNMKKYIDGLIEKIWEWRDEYLAAIRAMQNTNSSFSSNIAYDPNADYSALMGSVEYGSDEYNIYKGYREYKVNDPNYTGKGKNVSTARVDAFLRNGHTLAEIGKEYYTDLTEDEWIKYAGFKTGGYTGEWGPEGKLAYLHEKELVLNAKDTQNILNAVDLVRTISQKLDRQAQIAALGFASKANAHNGTNDSQTIQVEQDVTIHAEFPNATDQNEIKEAILGLVNYTAQYVAKR